MLKQVQGCLVAALVLAAAPAYACRGDKVLFSDDFKQVDSSWGLDTPDVQVEEGKVKVKPQPDISNLLIYKGILFQNASFCITVRMPNVMNDVNNTMAGPVFWETDYDNYYMFMVTPSGYAELTRKVKGKWIDVVEWRRSPDIKQGTGAKNVLEVVTEGDTISTYINGAKFASVKGQAPEGGGQLGMRAQSEPGQVDTWKFTALKVTNVPAAPAEAAPTTGQATPTPSPSATPTAQTGGTTQPAAPAQ